VRVSVKQFSTQGSQHFNGFPALSLLLVVLLLSGCKSPLVSGRNQFSHFTKIVDFSQFTRTQNDAGATVLLSPPIQSPIPWNQVIVSWNANAPAGTFLDVEACGITAGKQTKFYTLGRWSPDDVIFPRTSVRGQRDDDGTVETDTLVLRRLADAVQLRVTLGGTNDAMPTLKLLGVSFTNTKAKPADSPPNRAAWGTIISTPERSQHGYPGGEGWCSPTSLSMVLARWALALNRPEMNLTVPQVAAAVYDRDYAGTGNWPFNTAFAGSFSGMQSYVTRLDNLSEVEDWIAANIPVVLSTRWDLLEPGRPPDVNGHLVVCIGFTKDGDLVVNDPATHPNRGESVRRIYQRENVLRAWAQSHHAVYLVFPEDAKLPADRFGHW
jgi:hypothetical protein